MCQLFVIMSCKPYQVGLFQYVFKLWPLCNNWNMEHKLSLPIHYRLFSPLICSQLLNMDPLLLITLCSTTGKPTHLFRTKCVSLDSV